MSISPTREGSRVSAIKEEDKNFGKSSESRGKRVDRSVVLFETGVNVNE